MNPIQPSIAATSSGVRTTGSRNVLEHRGERDELVDPALPALLDELLHARLAAARVDYGEVALGVGVDEPQEAVEAAVELLDGGQPGSREAA